MLLNLVNWTAVLTAIENILLVSIPEEVFLVMFTLIILKQFDFLESKKDGENRFKKRDIIEISIPVLFVAVSSNIFRYYGVDINIIFLISVVSLFIIIVIVCKLWTIQGIIRTFFATAFSCFTLMIIEYSYIPIVLYITDKTVSDFNNSIFLNFILTIPERIIEYIIIVILLTKKATFLKANFIKPIIANKVIFLFVILSLVTNIVLFLIMGKLIGFEKVLVIYPLQSQIIIITASLIFPILNLFGLVGVVYYLANKELYRRYIARETLLRLTEDLAKYIRNKSYDKIELALKDVEANVQDIYLEKEGGHEK